MLSTLLLHTCSLGASTLTCINLLMLMYTITDSELTLYVDERGHQNKKQVNQLFSRLHSLHPEVFVGKILIASHDRNGSMIDIYYTLQYLKANDINI